MQFFTSLVRQLSACLDIVETLQGWKILTTIPLESAILSLASLLRQEWIDYLAGTAGLFFDSERIAGREGTDETPMFLHLHKIHGSLICRPGYSAVSLIVARSSRVCRALLGQYNSKVREADRLWPEASPIMELVLASKRRGTAIIIMIIQ